MTEPGQSARLWQISDARWQYIYPHLPRRRPKPCGGRPRLPDRQVLEAILFVAHSGCPWKQLPRELGAGSTVHDRFREWAAAGVFSRLHQAGLLDRQTLRQLQTRHPSVL
jgi:putative transposase